MSKLISGLHDPYEDQLAAARYRAERDALAQAMQRVADSMREHALGVEDMEDSPVAGWERDLRAALGGFGFRPTMMPKSDGGQARQEPDRLMERLGEGIERAMETVPNALRLLEEDEDAARWVREHGGLAMLELHEETFADLMRQRDEYRDLARGYERDATWVREHGGLGYMKSEWRSRVPYDCYERKRQRLLDHIAECETALGRRNDRIEELVCRVNDLTTENAELRKRAMPEGMEWLVEAWPRFEDGEPVRIGDEFECWCGETHVVSSVTIREGRSVLNERQPHSFVVSDGPFTAHGKRVKRPVIAADGEPLKVGQTVWRVDTGVEYWVKSGQNITADAVVIIRKTDCDCESEIVKASQLTHQHPVLDADGVPIHEGDTVYGTVFGGPFTVTEVSDKGSVFVDVFPDTGMHGSMFTHTKPEPDSWSSVWADVSNGCETPQGMERRCKALAEKED